MTRELPLDAAADVVRRWHRARCAAGRAKAAAEQAERVLLELMGDADVGTVDGQPAVRRRVEERPRIDSRALRAAHPDLVDEFTYLHRREELRAVECDTAGNP